MNRNLLWMLICLAIVLLCGLITDLTEGPVSNFVAAICLFSVIAFSNFARKYYKDLN